MYDLNKTMGEKRATNLMTGKLEYKNIALKSDDLIE